MRLKEPTISAPARCVLRARPEPCAKVQLRNRRVDQGGLASWKHNDLPGLVPLHGCRQRVIDDGINLPIGAERNSIREVAPVSPDDDRSDVGAPEREKPVE